MKKISGKTEGEKIKIARTAVLLKTPSEQKENNPPEMRN